MHAFLAPEFISSQSYFFHCLSLEIFICFLRGLLNEETFLFDIRSLADEPIPYFRQFATNDDAMSNVHSVSFNDDDSYVEIMLSNTEVFYIGKHS